MALEKNLYTSTHVSKVLLQPLLVYSHIYICQYRQFVLFYRMSGLVLIELFFCWIFLLILRNIFCVLYGFAVALGFQTLTFLWDVATVKQHISTREGL